MCLSPITIDNPNRGSKAPFVDSVNTKIKVPCGICPQCIATRQGFTVQRVIMESLVSHLFMGTLTYSPECLPTCCTSNGYTYSYADSSDFRNMIKRIRKYPDIPPFKYLGVSERGKKHGRPHFHFILSVPRCESDTDFTVYNYESMFYDLFLKEWRRNLGSTRSPIYKPLCNFRRAYVFGKIFTNFDFHALIDKNIEDTAGSSVAFYVTKYMLKGSKSFFRQHPELHNLDAEELNFVTNLCRDKSFRSLSFGYRPDSQIVTYLRECVRRSISDGSAFPLFYFPHSPKSLPLSRFYRSKPDIYTVDDHAIFWQRCQSLVDDPHTMLCDSAHLDISNRSNFLKSQVLEYDDFSDIFEEF